MVKLIAEVDDQKSASIKISRPKWDNVYNGYPKKGNDDMPATDVFKLILDEDYDKNTYSNACAVRVSIALINASVTIDEGMLVRKGIYKGKRVILGASTMKEWLEKKWGKADFSVRIPQGVIDLQAKFTKKKGIYIMIPNYPKEFGASGHCTLWTGENVIGKHHYANEYANAAYLWELK